MAKRRKSNWDNLTPQKSSAAQFHAESEFEKFRIVQDKLFMSDYDRYLLALEEQVKKEKEK